MKEVVLAYSGGLKAAVCIHYLRFRREMRVITFSAELGQDEPARAFGDKALLLGADAVHIADLREEFASEFILPTLQAGVVCAGDSYPAVALSRALITRELIKIARENSCKYIAHGGQAVGNDQARVRAAAAALAPDIKVIAPLREAHLDTDQELHDYATKRDLPVELDPKRLYYRDQNLLGRTVASPQTEETWESIPEELYKITTAPLDAPDKPLILHLSFVRGVSTRLDGADTELVPLIEGLNSIGGAHGIGRKDVIQTGVVGIKTRIVYEQPAAEILYTAHRALESIVLTDNIMTAKQDVASRYAALIHKGFWFSNLREAFASFVEKTQEYVTGTVRLRLYKGAVVVEGIRSPYSLCNRSLITTETEKGSDDTAAEGFLKIITLDRKLEAMQRKQTAPTDDETGK